MTRQPQQRGKAKKSSRVEKTEVAGGSIVLGLDEIMSGAVSGGAAVSSADRGGTKPQMMHNPEGREMTNRKALTPQSVCERAEDEVPCTASPGSRGTDPRQQVKEARAGKPGVGGLNEPPVGILQRAQLKAKSFVDKWISLRAQ